MKREWERKGRDRKGVTSREGVSEGYSRETRMREKGREMEGSNTCRKGWGAEKTRAERATTHCVRYARVGGDPSIRNP